MPITIGSNVASLSAQRKLGEGTAQLSSVFERLSSGQRINKASDDAAGLAISESLRADRKVFSQGVRNLNDGMSLLNIADGAVQQLSGIVIRLKELAEQGANGTYGVQQRKALDAEAQTLSKEYLRIVQSTKFNGRNLFDANFGDLRLQGGYGTDGSILSGLGGALGTGSFGSAASFVLGGGIAYGSALGDLNGDGNLDLVSSAVDGSISIRLGDGSGGFGAATTYSNHAVTSYAVVLGDLNNDGILDIITTGQDLGGIGEVKVRLGKGDGTFGNSISYLTHEHASFGLTLGDINGDGILDIGTNGYGFGSFASIRLGVGDGTFGTRSTYSTEPVATGIKFGDLNGDGILDMITSGDNGAVPVINVRLGTGNGTFGTATSQLFFNGSNGVQDAVLGDVNGDGKPDIVISGGFNGKVLVAIGNGNGTFNAAVSYITGMTQTYSILLGDLNGDGILDIAAAGYDVSLAGNLSVLLGQGNGSFQTRVTYATESGGSYALSLGDLNNDGVLDVVTLGHGGGPGGATVRQGSTTSGVSALLPFKLTSRAEALQALSQFDQKLTQLSKQRGTIGAFQSRLIVGTSVLQASGENYAAAEGRIRNTDLAEESANLARLNILQKAASSVLAQANLQPALALKLLKND